MHVYTCVSTALWDSTQAGQLFAGPSSTSAAALVGASPWAGLAVVADRDAAIGDVLAEVGYANEKGESMCAVELMMVVGGRVPVNRHLCPWGVPRFPSDPIETTHNIA